jgi:hypothetical protein
MADPRLDPNFDPYNVSPEQQAEMEKAAQAKLDADAAASKAAEADRARNAHFQYGGWAGGASEAASRYAKLGADAQGRHGETLALGAVNDDRNANAQARGVAGHTDPEESDAA